MEHAGLLIAKSLEKQIVRSENGCKQTENINNQKSTTKEPDTYL